MHVEVVAEGEAGPEVGLAGEFVEDDAVVEALDAHLAPAGVVEQFAAAAVDLGETAGADAEAGVRAGEIHAGLLRGGLKFEEHDVFRRAVADDGGAEGGEAGLVIAPAEAGGEAGGDLREVLPVGALEQHLPAGDRGEALELDELRQDAPVRIVAEGEVDREEVRVGRLAGDGESGGDGGGGVGAKFGRGELAGEVGDGADEGAGGGLVEEERGLRNAEIHGPVNGVAEFGEEGGVALPGERGIVGLAEIMAASRGLV